MTASLVVFEGTEPGQIFRLGDDNVSVGRADDQDIVLASPRVSKAHCQILARPGSGGDPKTYEICDMDSTNGVLVHGRRLAAGEQHLLQHGDTIRLSDHVLLFHYPTTPSAPVILETIELDRGKVDSDVEEALRKLDGFQLKPRREP